MNLVDYVKGLFPTFKKTDVIESCNLTKQMLTEHTLKSYSAASVVFKDIGFKSVKNKEFVSIYNKEVERVTDKTFVSSITKILENTIDLLDHISGISKSEFSNTETSAVLTYRKSVYLRTIQAAEFVNGYSKVLLNYIYFLETKELDSSTNSKLLPVEIKYLEDNYLSFCKACSSLKTNKTEYDRSIKKIPDATISDLTEQTFPSTIGYAELDPMNLRGIDATWNPFYFIGKLVATHQANVYKESQSTLEILQLRKLNLEKLIGNTPDPKLQKEIEYMQDRIDTLKFKIRDMEEQYVK